MLALRQSQQQFSLLQWGYYDPVKLYVAHLCGISHFSCRKSLPHVLVCLWCSWFTCCLESAYQVDNTASHCTPCLDGAPRTQTPASRATYKRRCCASKFRTTPTHRNLALARAARLRLDVDICRASRIVVNDGRLLNLRKQLSMHCHKSINRPQSIGRYIRSAIIASFDSWTGDHWYNAYPGRVCGAPIPDGSIHIIIK